MDLGQSDGGLPPDNVVQDTDAILEETEAAVSRYHDPSPGSMLRIAVAPCSPFSATERLMKESASLARTLGVRLHTHIAETRDEEAFCQQSFGRRPIVHLSERDVERIAATRTGVAWCPTSNLRLASGIAPARALLDAGATVGLGVDGSASNDSGDLLAEARLAVLVGRAGGDPAAMTARDVLRIATRGGAECLGRDDIGSIEPGKRADVALFGVDGVAFAGAEADPVAALVACSPQRVRHLFVDGQPVVQDERLTNADEEAIAAEGHRVARQIASSR
jgi:cytosine/adenosine deaminase-related metal-dependent hydrolase